MSVMQVVVLSPFLFLQDLSTGGQFNGVLVDCDTVLTVAHAVQDGSQVYCTAQAENHFVTFQGRVIKRNLKQDLALIRIENHVVYQVAPLQIASACSQNAELHGWERLGKP
jgi:S1-C subfamily serine protease